MKNSNTFWIKYVNEDSQHNGTEYLVREIPGEDHHYFISDGKSHIGGGRLSKKYCQKKSNDLKEKLESLECERYHFTSKSGVSVLFQRLNKDSLWYVVAMNQIVNCGQYRYDLEEWCDIAL